MCFTIIALVVTLFTGFRIVATCTVKLKPPGLLLFLRVVISPLPLPPGRHATKNLEVCVQITIKPTEASVAADKAAARVEAGHFRLVLEEGSLFAIDALEAGRFFLCWRCLSLIDTHLSQREIGERLYISTNTVKSHVRAIYRKLQATTHEEAAAIAHRQRLF